MTVDRLVCGCTPKQPCPTAAFLYRCMTHKTARYGKLVRMRRRQLRLHLEYAYQRTLKLIKRAKKRAEKEAMSAQSQETSAT